MIKNVVQKHVTTRLDILWSCFLGVRLYFTTTSIDRFEDRPSKLCVVHVRMPPGSAPSARVEKPSHVHAAYYRQGN